MTAISSSRWRFTSRTESSEPITRVVVPAALRTTKLYKKSWDTSAAFVSGLLSDAPTIPQDGSSPSMLST